MDELFNQKCYSDPRGFIIECIARNVSLEECARCLNITTLEFVRKLTSDEIVALDCMKLQELLSQRGSQQGVYSLFTSDEDPARAGDSD